MSDASARLGNYEDLFILFLGKLLPISPHELSPKPFEYLAQNLSHSTSKGTNTLVEILL